MKLRVFCLVFFFICICIHTHGQIRLDGIIEPVEKGHFLLIDVLGKKDTLANVHFDNFKFETNCSYPKDKMSSVTAVSYVIIHEGGSLSGIFFLENSSKVFFKFSKDKPFLEYYGSENADIMTNFFKDSMPFYEEYEMASKEKNEKYIKTVKNKISDYIEINKLKDEYVSKYEVRLINLI